MLDSSHLAISIATTRAIAIAIASVVGLIVAIVSCVIIVILLSSVTFCSHLAISIATTRAIVIPIASVVGLIVAIVSCVILVTLLSRVTLVTLFTLTIFSPTSPLCHPCHSCLPCTLSSYLLTFVTNVVPPHHCYQCHLVILSLCLLEAMFAQPIRSHLGSRCDRSFSALILCNGFGLRPFLDQHFCSYVVSICS